MKTDVIAKRIVWLACCALAATVCAMPTKQQISQAQPLVNDLTADDLRALKAKEKAPGDVAAAHLDLADKADTEAGKYLLLQGAFRLYARGGDYDAAAVPLQRMRGEIAELPPEVIVEIVNKEMRRVASEKAPKVLAIFRDAQRTIKYRKQLASAELNATAHPENVRYQRSLAECHACLGEWPKAIAIFAKIGDEAAKWELGMTKDCDTAKAADFWWNYKAPDAEPFKAHAASLYKKGLDDGSITGLRKTLAEKRVKEMEDVMTAAPTVANTPNAAPTKRGKSIMVKIKNGIELEFIPCPAGTFTMGADKVVDPITGRTRAVTNPNTYAYKHEVKITRPFWMSKYPITVEQFGAFCPIDDEFINQNGKQGEPKAPVCLRIAAAKDYCKWLNRRFASAVPRKCIFRLPTDAEWEYALFANSTDKDDPYVRLRDGEKAALQEICGTKFPVPVGTAGKPNAWGLYDMLGNGCHYVLDTISNWYVNQGKLYGIINHEKKYAWNYSENEADPLRWYVPDVPVEKGKSARHLMRGGCYVLWAAVKGPNLYFRMPECGDINRETDTPDCPRIWTFRVVIGSDLVAEKKGAKAANPAPVPATPTVHAGANTTPPANVKTHTIKLNNTVSMEFVECPAGSFMMGRKGEKTGTFKHHKVTITRPFWFAKHHVTREQWGVYDKKDAKAIAADDKEDSSMTAPVRGPTYEEDLKYCDFLTKRCRNMIPQGYVFRPPTEAEWEYALRANTTDPNDPYGKDATTDSDRKIFRTKPNAWGIHSMISGWTWMLDTVPKEGEKNAPTLSYEDEETDPLLIYNKSDACVICRGVDFGTPLIKWHRYFGRFGTKRGMKDRNLRLVIGPDLVAEKKAGKK